MAACSECKHIILPACLDSFAVKAGLQASTTYLWELTDKFNNKFSAYGETDADGKLTVASIDFPEGLFNEHAGNFKLEIYGGPYYNDLEAVDLTFGEDVYKCLDISFQKIIPIPEENIID